jgi:hypothetical protein
MWTTCYLLVLAVVVGVTVVAMCRMGHAADVATEREVDR